MRDVRSNRTKIYFFFALGTGFNIDNNEWWRLCNEEKYWLSFG